MPTVDTSGHRQVRALDNEGWDKLLTWVLVLKGTVGMAQQETETLVAGEPVLPNLSDLALKQEQVRKRRCFLTCDVSRWSLGDSNP
jgi:hypothetical protein